MDYRNCVCLIYRYRVISKSIIVRYPSLVGILRFLSLIGFGRYSRSRIELRSVLCVVYRYLRYQSFVDIVRYTHISVSYRTRFSSPMGIVRYPLCIGIVRSTSLIGIDRYPALIGIIRCPSFVCRYRVMLTSVLVRYILIYRHVYVCFEAYILSFPPASARLEIILLLTEHCMFLTMKREVHVPAPGMRLLLWMFVVSCVSYGPEFTSHVFFCAVTITFD